jgi:hypothetical protein
MKPRLLNAILLVCVLVGAVTVRATTWHVVPVSTAAQLQAALDVAKPGDSIRLAPGTYVGHFTLRNRGASGTLPIIIRSAIDQPAGRVSPTSASTMARIMSPDSGAAIATDSGQPVGGYVLKYLNVQANETQGDLIIYGRNDGDADVDRPDAARSGDRPLLHPRHGDERVEARPEPQRAARDHPRQLLSPTSMSSRRTRRRSAA